MSEPGSGSRSEMRYRGGRRLAFLLGSCWSSCIQVGWWVFLGSSGCCNRAEHGE